MTHLEKISSLTKLKAIKKQIKYRFWNEIYRGAKVNILFISDQINL
jgi:hypothetical protein